MAERIKIEGNFMIVFEDGSPSTEYINHQRVKITPSYDPSDKVRFFDENSKQLGKNGVVEFDCTTLMDDRTGLDQQHKNKQHDKRNSLFRCGRKPVKRNSSSRLHSIYWKYSRRSRMEVNDYKRKQRIGND